MTVRPLTISVVIPTYNRAQWIGRALEQAEVGEEVIVVDDGSTDRTIEVLAKYGDTVLVTKGPRGGPEPRGTAGSL